MTYMHLNRKYVPVMAFLTLCLIWSSTWMVLKMGLWSLPPFLAAGIRFLLAFFILYVYSLYKKISFPRRLKDHAFFAGFGFLTFSGGYAFVYWGQQHVASGLASVLFSVMPFYVLILSIWFLPQDKITLKKAVGVTVGFCGIVIIFWDQIEINTLDRNVLWGMLAVVSAPVFSSLGTIVAKKKRQTQSPITLTKFPMLYASGSFFLLSFLFETELNPVFDFNAVFSLLYLALFGTSIAFFVYFWLLKNASAVMMSMITFITPPLALVWGWLLLAEPITPMLVIGMILIFTGIFIVRN